MKTQNKKKEKYERYYLINDKGRDLEFNGILIAEVANNDCPTDGEYSGFPGRDRYYLFRTKLGKLIAAHRQIHYANGTSDRAKVCKNEEEIIKFFGLGWLAKNLYYEADISVSNLIK